MRNNLILRSATVWTASLGLLCPSQFLMAAGENAALPQDLASQRIATPVARKAAHVRDVELDQQGQLVGQLVDAQGQPIAGAAVTLRNQTIQLQTASNPQGQFQFSGLTGGTYLLETGLSETGQRKAVQGGQICRLWKNGTAPPKANQKMLVVQQNGQVALGQNCSSPVCGSPVSNGAARAKRLLTHPLVIGGLIAAAIAIPVAIHNSDDDNGPSS